MDTNLIRQQTVYHALRRTAARNPQQAAIRQHDVNWNYAEFHDLCLRVAGGLIERGIQPGDRVAILSRNSNAFAVARFAISAIGAVLWETVRWRKRNRWQHNAPNLSNCSGWQLQVMRLMDWRLSAC